jgi:putative Mn2+ efflux pump MntP
MFISIMMLALSVCMDSFGIGFTYGLRKIKIPLLSICIITLCSSSVLFLSMYFGTLLTKFFSTEQTKMVGGCILIGIGFISIVNLFRKNNLSAETVDLDQSGIITGKEAVLLGFLMSMDSFAAGVGAAFIGFSPFLTITVISLLNVWLLFFSVKLGELSSNRDIIKKLTFLPGMLLIIFGVLKILKP